MDNLDYKAAYERQKKARELAEELLENRSRDLYDSNQSLLKVYEKLKNQKAQLIHQEKLASIGQLSAGVAHEINNPTGFVKSNLNSLKRYMATIIDFTNRTEDIIRSDTGMKDAFDTLKKDADLEYILADLNSLIDESLEGIERVASIVTNLKDFSRADTESEQYYDVNICLQNTLKLVHSEIKYRAEIFEDYGDLPQVHGQPGSISQVFLNLIVNAAHAIDAEESDKGLIKISTKAYPHFVEIIVEDNGVGIPKTLHKKIFEPFYTSKQAGKGTGLGLSISDSIIRKQKGRILLESEEAHGARFRVQLPLCESGELANS